MKVEEAGDVMECWITAGIAQTYEQTIAGKQESHNGVTVGLMPNSRRRVRRGSYHRS